MVSLLLTLNTAAAAGFHAEAGWTSSFGPDAYETLSLAAEASPGLEVGAAMVGGARSALLGTVARRVRLSDGLFASGELQLGLAEEVGAVAGFDLGLQVQAGPVLAVAEGGLTGGLGWRVAGGVDAPLADRWWLSPRLRAESWAGDRDPALRAALGLRHETSGRLWWSAELSGGGRDVFHIGPGFLLAVGMRP